MFLQKPQVLGRQGALSLLCRVDIVPCLEEGIYSGIELVGAVREVNGAWPLSTPEFRSQVASGFIETPAQYCLEMIS
jgi:hypothetical protein